MSYCVTINNLEHLPQEETLLIHYTITCTGLWSLQQLSTAYRNVCDSEWTVMYPNHQHPRHSDFPIIVTQEPYLATFAWNYGGIQGITSTNFDEQHSYLVQLSLADYHCFNTGSVGSSGEASGSGGEPTGTTGSSEPSLPYLGSTTPKNPPPPPLDPPIPTFLPRPEVVEPNVFGFPRRPTSGLPPTKEPRFINEILPIPIPRIPGVVSIEPTNTSEPGVTGFVLGTTATETNINISEQFEVTTVTTQNNTEVGSSANPNLIFSSEGRSPSIPGEPSVLPGIPTSSNRIDINQVNYPLEGSVEGQLSNKYIEGQLILGSPIEKQVNISNLEYSASIGLSVASTEVAYGQPIVISSFFSPPSEMKATIRLYIQDSARSIEVNRTGLLNCSSLLPLTCGVSTQSSFYNLGTLVVTAKVLDVNDNVIGIKSIIVSNINTITPGNFTSSKATVSNDLPTTIIGDAGLSNIPISLDLTANKVVYLLLESSTPVTSVAAVLQTSDTSRDRYSMTVYVPTGVTQVFGQGSDETEIVADYINIPSSAYSDTRYKINNEEVYPYSHTVALNRSSIPTSSMIALEIAPSIGNGQENTQGRLYISTGFRLKEISGSVAGGSISAYLPYGGEKYGLVINGKNSGEVPTDYTEYTVQASSLGYALWTGVSILENDYYSIIQSRNNRINPFSTPVFIGQYLP